jgi:integrase
MPSKSCLQPKNTNDKIFNVLWELKKQGKAKDTIKNIAKCLKRLNNLCDLDNPDDILAFVANFDRKDGYKRNLIMAYEHYVKMYNLQWTKPKYHENAKMPKIPQENKINLIIANSPIKQAVAISISRDTGLRPVELTRLTLRNLDLVNGAVYPETTKHGSPRVLKLRKSTLNMLNNYLAKQNIGLNEPIFGKWNSDSYGKTFRYHRNKTAEKLQDPSIKTIRLYDLRHHFATMTYHRTKDILFTKQQMGHRKIETTLVYTQLLQFEKDENYTCRIAQNIEQATELIENGFEYVTEMEGVKLFRKRK